MKKTKKTKKKTRADGKKARVKASVKARAVKLLQKIVLVCVNCGSIDVESPSVLRGAVPGAFDIAGIYTCRKCGFTGLPVATTLSKAAKLSAYIKKKRKVRR